MVQQATQARNSAEARSVAAVAYPFRCCAICGLQLTTCLQLAHLDHNAGNNKADNLAHWQATHGVPDHKLRMKDAGAKAALTRKRRAAGQRAAATRRANIPGPS